MRKSDLSDWQPAEIAIRPIQPEDDGAVCHVIKTVGQEFGALGEGFGPSDKEVSRMSHHYRASRRSAYYVLSVAQSIKGGGGIAPFDKERNVCELRKLFLLPEIRGEGHGRKLTEKCLEFAQSAGYTQCYLDTLSSMRAAIHLYKTLGFRQLEKPLESLHTGCDVWMILDF